MIVANPIEPRYRQEDIVLAFPLDKVWLYDKNFSAKLRKDTELVLIDRTFHTRATSFPVGQIPEMANSVRGTEQKYSAINVAAVLAEVEESGKELRYFLAADAYSNLRPGHSSPYVGLEVVAVAE